MAISLVVKTTDTSTGSSPASITVAALNYGSDWRIRSQSTGEEILTNITTPTSYPETMRFAWNQVSDIYAGTDVEKALYLPTRRGLSFVVQLKSIYGLTDSDDATYAAALPMSTHIVCKVPNNELITAAVVRAHIARTLAGLYETGSTTTDRLEGLMRGVLTPKDL